jgi:hypothetical protein
MITFLLLDVTTCYSDIESQAEGGMRLTSARLRCVLPSPGRCCGAAKSEEQTNELLLRDGWETLDRIGDWETMLL